MSDSEPSRSAAMVLCCLPSICTPEARQRHDGLSIATVLDLLRQRHPQCELRLREGLPADPFGGLRAGQVDIGKLWLIREPDLAVGPEVHTEELVLAVAADHRLAGQDRVEMEDLDDYPVLFLDSPIPY